MLQQEKKYICLVCGGSKVDEGPNRCNRLCACMCKKEDTVNSPKHYTFGTIEVIDVIEDWGLDKEFHLANVIKYIARAKHKGDELESYKKAQWYLNRKIQNMELDIAAEDDPLFRQKRQEVREQIDLSERDNGMDYD